MTLVKSFLAGASIAALMATAALAEGWTPPPQPLTPDPVLMYAGDPGTVFEGFYTGLYMGGTGNSPNNFFDDYGHGWHDNRFAIGGMAGYNFLVTEAVLIGLELQGGLNFNTSGDYGFEGYGIGRLGFLTAPDFMAYLAVGAGSLEGLGAFVLGGGVEWALWDTAGVRLEALGFGELGDNPSRHSTEGFTGIKLTAGVSWYFY